MAEAPSIRGKPLEELEREITCSVCQCHYQKARLLPCNHYYCEACIEQLAKHSGGNPIDCPECRKKTSLPTGGAAKLPTAFFVERMKDVYCKMAKEEGRVEAVCEQCGEGKAVVFCRECVDFICNECERCHKRLKIFSGHVVSSLEDLKGSEKKNLQLKETPPMKCSEHDQVMRMYCFDCKQLICGDCTFIDHNSHTFDFLKKCALDVRKTLRENLISFQDIQANIAGAEKVLFTEEAKVDSHRESVCKSIEETFEQLQAFLEKQKEDLVKRTSAIAQEKKDILSAQKKKLIEAKKEIKLMVESVERNIESMNDQDLMSIHTYLKAQIKTEKEHHQQLKLKLTSSPDIGYDFSSSDIIPKNLCIVFSNPDNISCEVDSPLELRVFTTTPTSSDISAQLKSMVNPSLSLHGDIVQESAGIYMYSIRLYPQIRGQHNLRVRVKDREITGSPFPVFASVLPSRMGENVYRVGGFDRPWGIAINNKKQLVVAESFVKYCGGGQGVTIRDMSGDGVRLIRCAKFKDPRGVAVGPDGAIYVTDIDAHSLFKFSEGGTLLKTVDNELQKPYTVKIIQNQLYVVDYTSCLVKKFDMDCNVTGIIQIKECPKPRDVTQGPDCLYVAGKKKICVYSENGDFIHYLNIKQSTLEFSEFNGICYDSSSCIIYACDFDNGVCAFRNSGELVKVVSCRQAAGIAIDQDGFVYVCGINVDAVFVL